MNRLEREIEKHKIKAKYQTLAISDSEHYLSQIKEKLEDVIALYKKNSWKENKTFGEVLQLAKDGLKAIERRKRNFKHALINNIKAKNLYQFDCDGEERYHDKED